MTITTALNHRKRFEGGDTKPQVFVCDDGAEWVLKLLGNRHGTLQLAGDWLGTSLGCLVGAPVLTPNIVAVTTDAIETLPDDIRAWALPGPAFATEYLGPSAGITGSATMFEATNLEEMTALAVLDTWIDTTDRRKPNGDWNLLMDTREDSPRLVAIDQGLALSEPLGVVALVAAAPDTRLRLPDELVAYVDWSQADAAKEKMLQLTIAQLTELAGSVCPEWVKSPPPTAAIVSYLDGRRDMVAKLVEGRCI